MLCKEQSPDKAWNFRKILGRRAFFSKANPQRKYFSSMTRDEIK